MDTHVLFDRDAIEETIPHREPFLLIDAITAFNAEQNCSSTKFVDPQDSVFQGHFPGQPVMPGVLIVEHMAQTACFLLCKAKGSEVDGIPVLGKVKSCSFIQMVKPGDTLETTVTLTRALETFFIFKAESKVRGETVARCEMVVSIASTSGEVA